MAQATKAKPKYTVLVGIDYPDGKGGELRAEPGDVVDDLPAKSIGWLTEQAIVALVEG